MKLFNFVDYSIWLSAITGIYFFKKLEPRSLKILVAFVIIVISLESILPKIFEIDRKHYYQRLYTFTRPIEFLIIAYCYFDLRNWKSKESLFINIVIIGYFIYTITLFVIYYDDKYLGNNTSVVSYTLLIMLMLIYYKNLLSTNQIIVLSKSPLFIYSIGILIFSCGNVIVTGFYLKIAEQNKEVARTLYKFMNYGLLITKSITLIIAFFVASRNYKQKYE